MTSSANSGADLTDAAVIKCRNGSGGTASVSYSGSCTVPGNAHEEETDSSNVHSVGKHISVRVFGSKGLLTYEGDDQNPASGRLALTKREGGPPTVVDGFLFENYAAEGDGPESLQAFIDCCNGEKDAYVGVDARVGEVVVRALDALYRSAQSGSPEALR